MPKARDLHGQVFGKLTVIELAEPKNKHKTWLCQCDCGNRKIIQQSSLVTGNTKSCGCLYKVDKVSSSMIGKTFGMLTVVAATDKRQNISNTVIWSCKCTCGAICAANTNQLNRGKKKSCGCLKGTLIREKYEEKRNDEGVVAHNLRSKMRTDNKSGHKGVYWDKRRCKWNVELKIKNERFRKGGFETLEEAIECRKELEEIYHKPHLDRAEGRYDISMRGDIK